jgi:hypothetical protein
MNQIMLIRAVWFAPGVGLCCASQWLYSAQYCCLRCPSIAEVTMADAETDQSTARDTAGAVIRNYELWKNKSHHNIQGFRERGNMCLPKHALCEPLSQRVPKKEEIFRTMVRGCIGFDGCNSMKHLTVNTEAHD